MKELLERLGWSQAYFAKHMNISRETVSGWVRARSGGPGYEACVKYLELVARFLKV